MENIEIKFTEDEWNYFCLIEKIPADMKCTVVDLAEQTGDSVRSAKKVLAGLVERGYLMPRNFQISRKGEQVYQKHLRYWNGIIWLLRSWGLPEEQLKPLADKLLCGTTNQLVEGAMEQLEKDQAKQTPAAECECIDNTDFYGQIDEGDYVEGVIFWDLEDKSHYFYQLSPVGQWFAPQAHLVIELQKSRLVLRWISSQVQLNEISYYMIGRERHQQPEGPAISLPIMAFSFNKVSRYGMLEGKLDVTVRVSEPGEDGTQKEAAYRVRLELPMISMRPCDMTDSEVNHEG